LIATLQQQAIPLVRYHPDNVIAQLQQWQVKSGVVLSFSQLFPLKIIQYFAGQMYNIHPSALPDYRGNMPLYWQIRHNKDETKLSLVRVTERIDAGDIGYQLPLPIHPFDNYQSLNFAVMELAPQLLLEARQQEEKQGLNWRKQRPLTDQDFYARKLNQDDVKLGWAEYSAVDIAAAIRAANPHFGGLVINFAQGQCQVMQASVSQQPDYGVKPGTILCVNKNQGLIVATKKGALSLDVIVSQTGYFSGYTFAIKYKLYAGASL
jgi:methionyl-tRNA formyltransferase